MHPLPPLAVLARPPPSHPAPGYNLSNGVVPTLPGTSEAPLALRKCPGCKNTIAAETLTCPICGCNPRTCRLRKILFWSTASVVTIGLLGARVRQHGPGLGLVNPPTQAAADPAR